MSGRRRLRLSQETIRYPSRDSVSLKNPEEIPLHLKKLDSWAIAENALFAETAIPSTALSKNRFENLA